MQVDLYPLMLRPYQEECVRRILAAYEQDQYGKETIVLPTGAGKTVIFCHIIQHLFARYGVNTLIIAHRDELLEQAAEKYRLIKSDAVIGKVGAGVHDYGGEVTVASIATISRPEHLRRLKAIGYGLIIVDEAHHCQASSYQAVLKALPDAFVLQVTATPDRLDGKDITDGRPPLYSASIIDMIAQRYLCDLKAVAIRTETSLDGLHTELGDYNTAELEAAVDTPVRNTRVVEAYQERALGRRAICFAVTVEHAAHLADSFNRAGIPAAIVCGETPLEERKGLYKALREGTIKVLTNVQVLSEGFDEPRVDCVIMARPTQSRALFVQCLDTATQILTPEGWKSHHEIQEGDLVAGFDKDTEEIRWVPALRKVERPLASDEKMYVLQSPVLDIRVTGGHRMLFRARRRSCYAYTTYGLPQWRFAEAQELYEKKSEYEIPIAGKQNAPGVLLTDDELRFIGWFLTDGTLNKKTNGITIYQAEHQPHHVAIKSCLEGCGFKYTIHKEIPKSQHHANSLRIRYTISKGQPRGIDKHLTGWSRLEPYIDKNLSPAFEDITAEQLEVLLETIHLGDGAKQLGQYWERQSYHIATGNHVFAERLQSLCVRRGFKCNIGCRQRETGSYYMLHIKKKTACHIGGQHCTDRPHLEFSPSNAGETVWCVENELSTLIIRRNGKVAFVGNCLGRGLRLAPAKENCLILDITDNCLKHRLEPQNLQKALGKKINDEESVLETLEREARQEQDKRPVVRTLKERRNTDLDINLLVRLDWHEQVNGTYTVQIGDEGHCIELVPSAERDDYYSVWAYLAPTFERQRWLADVPLDWAQQYAERRARLILADPQKVKLVDRNAAWRLKPVDPLSKQAALLRRFRIPIIPQMTKGEASDLLEQRFAEQERRKAERGTRKPDMQMNQGA